MKVAIRRTRRVVTDSRSLTAVPVLISFAIAPSPVFDLES